MAKKRFTGVIVLSNCSRACDAFSFAAAVNILA